MKLPSLSNFRADRTGRNSELRSRKATKGPEWLDQFLRVLSARLLRSSITKLLRGFSPVSGGRSMASSPQVWQ